jgi:hypothetical protein
MAKEAISKKDTVGSSHLIRNLMCEIAGKHPLEKRFCELYQFILKQLPDFQFALAEDQVLSTFAPNQLKETVKEIFQNLKKLVPQGN